MVVNKTSKTSQNRDKLCLQNANLFHYVGKLVFSFAPLLPQVEKNHPKVPQNDDTSLLHDIKKSVNIV